MIRTDTSANDFGALLKQLRHRVGMTQGELAALVGLSLSQISLLEKNKRQPDLQQLVDSFIPGLALADEPQLAQRLLELAADARGEKLSANLLANLAGANLAGANLAGANLTGQFSVTRTVNVTVTEEEVEYRPLPSLPVRVIGRQAAINTISKRLMESPGRLLTLLGSPGVGKTTLAIAVAALVQPFFHEGVAFVELATVNDPTQLAATLANTLGLSDSSNKPAQSQLVEFLRRKSMLLVLDNCEQLLPAPHSPPAALESVAARLIADLLAECPNLRVLATSREPLRLRAEQRQPVPPLDLSDAVALFVERAQAVEPEFVLAAPQQPLVEAICNRLDGLPLAIELIAARADLLSLQEMLDRLNQQPLHRLASDLRDLPERHRTLHNAILHSYALLSRAEQQAFRALGLFVGGFDPGSAAAVGIDEMVLRSLVKKSLIRRDGSAEGKDRYTLLEVLRHFALEQLQVENEEAALRIRHLAYFADYAQAIFKGVRGEQQGEWLRRGRIDHDNFREALRFALQERHCEQAISIAGGLWWFWYRQGFINEGRSWLAQSLQCAPTANGEAWTPASNDSKRRRAIACNGAGSMASEQGDFESAIASFQAAMALYTDLDDPIGSSAVLHNMGLVASGQGNYAQAMRWLEDSLRLEQKTENPQIALGTANLGITAYEMGDLPLAKEWLEKAWQLAQVEVDTWAQAFIANGMAEVLRAMGDLERATLLAHESLRRFVQLNDQHYLPEPSLILANIALTRGDAATARSEALAVLQQYQELKDDHGIANTLFVLARLTLVESDNITSATRAATLLGVSIHLRSQVGRRLSVPEEKERRELRAAIEQRIGAAETEQLIRNAPTVDWQQMLILRKASNDKQTP